VKELGPADSISEEAKELGPADSIYGLIIQENILTSQIEKLKEELRILTEEKSIVQAANVIEVNVRTVIMILQFSLYFKNISFNVSILRAICFDFLKYYSSIKFKKIRRQ
jgi:hypothetical protein